MPRPDSFAQPRVRTLIAAAVLLVALAAIVAASHASAASTAPQLKVAKTKLGSILVNAQGRTLYMFAADKGRKSECYASCAVYWPPLITSSTHPTGSGVTASMIGTTMRKGGKLQVTYNGHPLYLFVKDSKPGQTSGQGLNLSGGLWWVMSPAGTVIKSTSHTNAATTQPPTSGGYGY
jgi:predicted lipoprotein with Yx(FWY)xxD motif